MSNNNNNDLDRREALKALAKLSAYSAPTLTMLLTSSLSHAQGSGVPASLCGGRINRNPIRNRFRNAANEGGNGIGTNLPNTTADCGIAGNSANNPI